MLKSSKSKPSKENHIKGGAEKELKSYNVAKEGSSKTLSGKKGKSKDKSNELTPKTNYFLRDEQH